MFDRLLTDFATSLPHPDGWRVVMRAPAGGVLPGRAVAPGRASRRPEPRRSLRARLHAAWRRYRSRQQIARLSPHLLKDIGVSYAEAEAEANKPFWIA